MLLIFENTVIPVWSAEVSSHTSRGSFLAAEFFLNIAGLALAYWIEMLVSVVFLFELLQLNYFHAVLPIGILIRF